MDMMATTINHETEYLGTVAATVPKDTIRGNAS